MREKSVETHSIKESYLEGHVLCVSPWASHWWRELHSEAGSVGEAGSIIKSLASRHSRDSQSAKETLTNSSPLVGRIKISGDKGMMEARSLFRWGSI